MGLGGAGRLLGFPRESWQFCMLKRRENLCQYFFHCLLQNRLKELESGDESTGHLVSLTPILRGWSNEELLKRRLMIIPLGTAEPHHFNGIRMRVSLKQILGVTIASASQYKKLSPIS